MLSKKGWAPVRGRCRLCSWKELLCSLKEMLARRGLAASLRHGDVGVRCPLLGTQAVIKAKARRLSQPLHQHSESASALNHSAQQWHSSSTAPA
jgi:hypothetical protein